MIKRNFKVQLILLMLLTTPLFFLLLSPSQPNFETSFKQISSPTSEDNLKSAEFWSVQWIHIAADNWTDTYFPWLQGSGTSEDPYIIGNITVNPLYETGRYGIHIEGCHKNFIIRNVTVYNSQTTGIYLMDTDNGTISNNSVSDCGGSGIYIGFSNYTIEKNVIHDCDYCGIGGYKMDNSTFTDNIIYNCESGIISVESVNLMVNGNTIYDCSNIGLRTTQFSVNNSYFKNNITHCGYGIYIDMKSNSSKFFENSIENSTISGIQIMSESKDNLFYNNYIKNPPNLNANDNGLNTKWDNGSLGNYWHNYGGVDSDDDGIGDTAHTVPGLSHLDNYPIWDDGFNGSAIEINDLSPSTHDWKWARKHVWCKGSGTELDPYAIRDLNINCTAAGSVFGISIQNSNAYFVIENCTLTDSDYVYAGLKLMEVSNARIIENHFYKNAGYGIASNMVSFSSFDSNEAHNNTDGMHFVGGGRNNITNNICYNNSDFGIFLDGCDMNRIQHNTLHNNSDSGILIQNSAYSNILINNTISQNVNCGVWLDMYVTGNNISLCTISNNNIGISISYDSDTNTIFENQIQDNKEYGALVLNNNGESENNSFYFNHFSNSSGMNAYDNGTNTHWDNGTMGNWWSDYTSCDSNGDGIGETPYSIPGYTGSQDRYPITTKPCGNSGDDDDDNSGDDNSANGDTGDILIPLGDYYLLYIIITATILVFIANRKKKLKL